MITSLIRLAKRLAVLLPVLIIAYVSVFNIFPWLSDHLPIAAAIIVTYIIGAYILVPALIRLARIIFPARHLPLYCVTADGFASDPLNIGIIGTRTQIIDAMTTAGWHQADKLSFRTAARIALSTVYGWQYPKAPMSNLYLFGRKQDLGFQVPIVDGTPGSRHHVRFWAVSLDSRDDLSIHTLDWQHREEHLHDDRLLWVGAASRDIGVTFIRHNAQITHLVDPDTDSERDLIASQLTAGKLAMPQQTIALGEPYKLINIHALRGHLHTDGKMKILEITDQTAS